MEGFEKGHGSIGTFENPKRYFHPFREPPTKVTNPSNDERVTVCGAGWVEGILEWAKRSKRPGTFDDEAARRESPPRSRGVEEL